MHPLTSPIIGNQWQIPSLPQEIAASSLSKSVFYAESATSEKVMRCLNIALWGATLASSAYWLVFRSLSILACIPLILAARKIIAVTIGYFGVYPATLGCRDSYRVDQVYRLNAWLKFEVKRVTLNKSGVNYDAYLLTNPKADPKKWTLYAGPNCMRVDEHMVSIVHNFDHVSLNYPRLHPDGHRWHRVPGRELTNYLLVNGPAAGRSQGSPTSYQFGAGFEAALQFLEKEMQATHIIMKGLSLGGGALSKAILLHDFEKVQMDRQTSGNPKVHYLMISDRTFSRLSDAASAMVFRIVRPIFFLLGIELNGIDAAKKLEKNNIEQIIIQNNGDDGIIAAKASLAEGLKKEGILKNKILLQSDAIRHNGDSHSTGLPKDIQKDLHEKIQSFLNTSSSMPRGDIDWDFWVDKGQSTGLKTAFSYQGNN